MKFYFLNSIISQILERCYLMSHFTVLVIGKDVEKQLEPYAEQDFDSKYGVFESKEEEYRTEYENDTMEAVAFDGQIFSIYDSQFSNYSGLSNERKYPANAVLKTVPMKEVYATFEDYLVGWHGVHGPDEETGQYGYWTNPNAQWDWYVIGGRWTGYFKPKLGSAGALGQSGTFDNKPLEGWVDQINYGDVDFDGMKAHEAKEAHALYDKIEGILKGREIPSWEKIRESHPDDIQAARDEYHAHPVMKDFRAAEFHYFGDMEEEFGGGREAYVRKCTNRTAVPYAVLKDGKWYQKGEMGWFGMSSDNMTQEEWNDEFWKLLESLDDDTLLTLVDCHI